MISCHWAQLVLNDMPYKTHRSLRGQAYQILMREDKFDDLDAKLESKATMVIIEAHYGRLRVPLNGIARNDFP